MTIMQECSYYGNEVSTLGERISVARERTGLTCAEVAARLAVREDTVTSWEDDCSEPRANKLVTLAGVVGVSPVWLMTGSGEGVPAPNDTPLPNDSDLRERLSGELREMQSLQQTLTRRINRIADTIATIE